MVLDRDYPMTRTQVRILLVGLAVMAVIGVALFGGYLPGIKPNLSGPAIATVDGRQYYTEATPLKIPFLANSTPPWNVSFRNVTFELSLSDWYSATGGIVRGNGTEASGTRYPFELGELFANGSRAQLYLSPDGVFGVGWGGGWLGGFSAELLVSTSYSGTT
jgi:hypothetical protein